MFGGVDHDPSVLQSWLIFDLDVRDEWMFEQLGECLHGIDIARILCIFDLYSFFTNFQSVCFFGQLSIMSDF